MSTQRILFLAPACAVTRLFPELRDAGYEVGLAENLKGALAFIRKSSPAVIFSRPMLSGYRVEELLETAQQETDFPPIVILTDKGTAEEAERLMDQGAHDYWLEPVSVDKVVALARKPKRPLPAPATSTLGGRKPDVALAVKGAGIVGSHPVMRRVLALAKQVAPSKASVLISGESGTGKEMFARTLHGWSNRRQGAFIAVNCAALPEHLLESELFGHEKGAFTGAIARKPGKFELADGGTILLDEISEMEIGLQGKLLRVLQEGEIDRVGGTETLSVDVRVLATTNRDLAAWVQEGKFRQDLFFRLNVIPLRLPSLRERGNDILELAHFFLAMYVREYQLPPCVLSPEAIAWLQQYDWPGNVRELQNLMERAVLLAGGAPISPRHFLLDDAEWPLFDDEYAETMDGTSLAETASTPEGHALRAAEGVEATTSGLSAAHGAGWSGLSEGDSAFAEAHAAQDGHGVQPALDAFSGAVIPLHEMERLMILKGLEATSGNRTQAAELLGISVRTLRNKLNEYRSMGMEID